MLDVLRSLRKSNSPNKTIHGRREDGNIIVWVILFFPLLFATFGISVDASLASYTRANLQSSADAATLSVVTHANNPTIYNSTCTGNDGYCQVTPYLTPIRANNSATSIPLDRRAIYTGANPMFNEMYGNGRQNVSNNGNAANSTPLLRCQTTPSASLANLPAGYRSWGEILNEIYAADGNEVRSTAVDPYQSAYLFGSSGSFGGTTNASTYGNGWRYVDGSSLREKFNSVAGNGDYQASGFLATPPSNSLQSDGNNCSWTMAFAMIVNTVSSINIHVTLIEESNTIFLRMFGINTLSYYVESSARTAFR